MIVINASLYNTFTDLSIEESQKLKSEAEKLNVDLLPDIYTEQTLINVLNSNKNQDILLFINFPPLEFYEYNNVSESLIEKYLLYADNWAIPEYKVSAGLLKYLCGKYKFVAIHVITGAHKSYVTDANILSLTGDVPTTIKRKHDWKISNANPEELMRTYLVDKIREAL